MIFQRGNPLAYERWPPTPAWRTEVCALPAVPQADGDLPGRRRTSTGAATARWCWNAARPPARCSRRPSPRCSGGLPDHDDVNGYRQEGFAAFDRNIHRGRGSARPGLLHPVISRPNLEVTCRAFVTKILFEGERAVGVEYRAGPARGGAVQGRSTARRPAAPRSSCAAARSTPRSSSSCPAWARRSCCAGRRPASPTCPAWARTSRTTWRSTCSTGRSSRCRWPRRSSCATGPWSARGGCSCAAGRGDQPFRGRRVHPQQRGGGLPEPHVPLPAHRDPLRRLVAGGRARVPGAHRADELRLPRLGPDRLRDPAIHPALRFNYLSTRTTAGSGPRPSGSPGHPVPARDGRVQRGRAVPGPEVGPRSRSWSGSGGTARRRCTRRAPPRWAPARRGDRSGHNAGARAGRVAGRRRLGMPYITNGNIYAPVMMRRRSRPT